MRTLQTYLPLSGEVTVTGGDTEQESIVVHKVIWCNNGIIGLGGSVKQFENVLVEVYHCQGLSRVIAI